MRKVESKGRSKDELHEVIRWLTGIDESAFQGHLNRDSTFEELFAEATLNPNAHLVSGVICGCRIDDIENPLTKMAKYPDKLVDELAKGRKVERILRQ